MKLIRFGEIGLEKPGILSRAGLRKDLSEFFSDWDQAFFRNDGLQKLSEVVCERGEELPTVTGPVRWGAPVARPGKVVCIGLNFRDHAEEAGMELPTEPIVFLKGSNAVVGPYDDVLIPRRSRKTDWEVELAVVIGRDARYLDSVDDAPRHIAGYTILHDVSERAFQLEHLGQWVKGKSCDTFGPLGPFLATSDEISDIRNLEMTLDVNRQRKQTGTTSAMVFDVFFLVHYLSHFMTLEAGDVISTGTPAGVGAGQKPPQYLRAGDDVELSIQCLGTQRQTFRDA